MDKRGKQISKKRKFQVPEEDDKQNESILEEVLNISGKNVETSAEKDELSPVQLKRSANKKDKPITEPKKVIAKKLPVSPPTSPSPKRKKLSTVGQNELCNIQKGQPVPTLPDGWRRDSVVRRSGKSAGQTDIYFYSPDGRKLRSRPDVASYLFTHNIDINLDKFDFSKKSKSVAKKEAKGISAVSIKKEETQEVKVNEVELKNSKAMSAEMSKSPRKVRVLLRRTKPIKPSEKSPTKVPSLVDAEGRNDPKVNEVESKNSLKGMSAKGSKPTEKLSPKVPALPDTEDKKDPDVNEVECKSSSKARILVKSKPSEKSPTKEPSLVDAEGRNDPKVNEVESKNSSKSMSAKRSKPTEKLSPKVPALPDTEDKIDPEVDCKNSPKGVPVKKLKKPEKKSNTVVIKILASKPKRIRK